MDRTDLASLSWEDIQQWFVANGEKAFRGRQVYQWIHKRLATSFDQMTDVSKELRLRLKQIACIVWVEILEEKRDQDGTIKFRFGLQDGQQVEGVWMPEEKRHTLCVSTQVGCAMGCRFCATGTMGLTRNLSVSEIVGQLEAVVRRLQSESLPRPVSNVVFMGMGEPLANLDNVLVACQIMLSDQGLGLSKRHITISTIGLVPAMKRFFDQTDIKLAISLNATSDEVRNRIMPINQSFSISDVLQCCQTLPLAKRDRITFEYVLLDGVNDSDADAKRLAGLLSPLRAKVNLIPYNAFSDLPYGRPSDARVEAFQQILMQRGLSAFIRRSRGLSLQAACGQLVTQADSQT